MRTRRLRLGSLLLGLLLAVLGVLATNPARASVIYDFTPYNLGGGYSIDGGTITVTDTAAADGFLAQSEVQAFTISLTTPANMFLLDSCCTGAGMDLSGPIRISSTAIYEPLSSVPMAISISGPAGVSWWSAEGNHRSVQIVYFDPIAASYVSSPVLDLPDPGNVATAEVPEPSVAVLFSAGLVGFAVRRRSVSVNSRAVPKHQSVCAT
jgi:PEP-CTERM motif